MNAELWLLVFSLVTPLLLVVVLVAYACYWR